MPRVATPMYIPCTAKLVTRLLIPIPPLESTSIEARVSFITLRKRGLRLVSLKQLSDTCRDRAASMGVRMARALGRRVSS